MASEKNKFVSDKVALLASGYRLSVSGRLLRSPTGNYLVVMISESHA
jgi:hypothetical protein